MHVRRVVIEKIFESPDTIRRIDFLFQFPQSLSSYHLHNTHQHHLDKNLMPLQINMIDLKNPHPENAHP
jgi:hypothetical protein